MHLQESRLLFSVRRIRTLLCHRLVIEMTNPPSDKIPRAEMRRALIRSGYLLECRVESLLREHWGYAEANGTYPDPETGKSREFDLFGMFAHQVGPDNHDFLFGVLLIECINNPQPLAILTKEPLAGFLHHEEVKMAGLPVKIPDQEQRSGWQRMSDFLAMKDFHHYCNGRVGTQFCSFVKKKSGRDEEWMAMHEGSHFDSFRKLCDVTDYYVDKHFKHWSFDTKEHLNIELYYPVIILQGDLVEACETKRSVAFRSADHIQFRQSVATRGKVADYQIDVIRERYLPKYLELIDSELKKTARLLRRRHEIIRSAIDAIVKEAKDADSPEQKRRIMDYAEGAA